MELKKSTSELKEAVISIAAILNKHGKGALYFGIKNDGVVIGQQAGKETLRDISQAIAEHIEPRIFPQIKIKVIQHKPCIAVYFKGSEAPYFAYGRVPMRVADADRQLSAKELEKLFLDKNRDQFRWDIEPCSQADLSDISAQKVKIFTAASGLKYDTVRNVFVKLKIMSGSKIRNAAIVLFGKKPEDIFSNARLRCAVFGGTDTAFIVDMKDYYGDVFYLIEKAQEYILEKIHIGMRIEGLRRIDVPEIDREAFREAIINAFCHRDYREPDSVNVAVFKDRVEIRSPGLLYGGLTIKQIRSKIVSERRNELIADMFHRIHFVEKWGRGIKLILDREPATKFMEIGTHFIVVFKRKSEAQKEERTTEEGATQKTTQKTTQKIIFQIKSDPQVSRKQLAEAVGLSEEGIKYHLAQLKKKGIIKRIGPDKGGYWKIGKVSKNKN